MLYRLWFVLDSNGSFYSVFCNCKCGADQECRHFGAVFDGFFFQIKESLSPVCMHIRTPNQQLHTNQCLIQKLKLSLQHCEENGRKNDPPYEDSWIDFFDPRLRKHGKETVAKQGIEFAKPYSRILDSSPSSKDLHDNEQSLLS